MALIGSGESGSVDPYNVIYGHHEKSLAKPITTMTLNELLAAQAVWGKQWGSSAAGFFQIMPPTLQGLMKALGLSGTELFTPTLQDTFGYQLLLNRGYQLFLNRSIVATTFGKQLAEEWASMPVLADTQGAHQAVKRGQSYYAGDGLNKAGIAPERVEAVLSSLLGAPSTTAPTPPSAPGGSGLNPLEQLSMNISILSLIIHYLPLLPFLQQDLEFEVKNITSSSDGQTKLNQTLVVLKDVISQIEAVQNNTTIPPSPTT